jgi:serine/threonine protein kinase
MDENKDLVEKIDNKYPIIEIKGRGATADVYLVKIPENDNYCAGKVLKQETDLFEKEVEILNRLRSVNNPYIVNLLDSGCGEIIRTNKSPKTCQYLILEYAPKGELFNYVFCPRAGLQEKYSKIVFAKILKGIQACHNLGICHRDLKMQNILLDANFNPKICDFGFATLNNNHLTDILGTPNYAAPEILYHQPYDGCKADIFSLGVVLLTLVSCKIGFFQAKKTDKYYKFIMTNHYKTYWKLVSKQVTGISEEVKKLYLKMVSFSPNERPSIEQILNDNWFNEIRNLNNDQLNALENEMREEFKKREIIVNKELRINAESNGDNSSYMDETRAAGDDEKEYFDLSLKPKYAQTGLNMNNYIKIKGELNPAKYMNSLVNKIVEKNPNCTIEESKKSLKFNVIFEEEEEEEKEEEEKEKEKEGEEDISKELEEEMAKLGIKENDEDEEEGLKKKDCVIQVKMFESLKEGHLLRFTKKDGEIEDYYKNLEKVIALAKELL